MSVDDSVLGKPYAKYIALTGYYYSGKHHQIVKGINIISLLKVTHFGKLFKNFTF